MNWAFKGCSHNSRVLDCAPRTRLVYRPTMLRFLALLLLLPACAPVDDDDDSSATSPEPISAELRALDAFGGTVDADVTVVTGAFDDDTAATDSAGEVTVTLTADAPFRVRFEASGYAPHELVGVATDDFAFTTLMGSRAAEAQVYGLLGLTADPSKGTLVVDLHEDDGTSPATGGSVSIDADHDAPFIFMNSGPQSGSTLLPGANTFVTFPNVTAGEVTITPDHPDADCLLGPAREAEFNERTWDVPADTVVVVDFICA